MGSALNCLASCPNRLRSGLPLDAQNRASGDASRRGDTASRRREPAAWCHDRDIPTPANTESQQGDLAQANEDWPTTPTGHLVTSRAASILAHRGYLLTGALRWFAARHQLFFRIKGELGRREATTGARIGNVAAVTGPPLSKPMAFSFSPREARAADLRSPISEAFGFVFAGAGAC
jgi:hypothetical protein